MKPRLSIVIGCRNDGHGGNMLRRLRCFVSLLNRQCLRFQCGIELIVVEWNPPGDQPRLKELDLWPAPNEWLELRLIEAPRSIHQTLPHSGASPFFQYYAKNVGIRRAAGEFVLSTNMDVLLSDEMFRFIAQSDLAPNRFYRADRWDVSDAVLEDGSVDHILEMCEKNLTQVFTREGVYKADRVPAYRLALWEINPLLAKFFAFISLFFGTKNTPHWVCPPSPSNAQAPSPSRLEWLLRAYRHLRTPGLPPLHLGASGDFMLMAKEKWLGLRGYPELDVLPVHVDSLLCLCAYYSGMRETVLRGAKRVYHVEHHEGWGPHSDRDGTLEAREAGAGIKALRIDDLIQCSETMKQKSAPIRFNQADWGLDDRELPETTINRWDTEHE